MKYQLIKPINEKYNAIEQILTNRNISYNQIKDYLNTTDEIINDYNLLGKDALKEAAMKIAKCVKAEADALVIIDSDCDGFTSSALLINYLYDLFPAWVENHLTWFMHEGKQHGLSDLSLEPESVGNYKLILIPDASSNDYKYHEVLHEQGIDIVVLDHHEAERISQYATIINNQLSDYPNKEMSGVGIVWQFCKYIDNLMGVDYADKYLDLVALGMDADMMSMASFETKHLINKGLLQIQNPFFLAMVEKAAFKMKEPTPMGVAFYVAPFVNAAVRSGTQEEKEIIFQSMLNHRAFEKIPSNKRGHRPGEMEQVYVQAARTATNVKNRQTRAQDAGLAFLEKMIEDQNLLEHKVLLFLLEPGQIDKNIAGLVANKFMAKYQRPCCILTKVVEENKIMSYNPDIEYEEWDPTIDIAHGGWRKEKGKYEECILTKVSYQGSARGCDKTGITNFKDICEQTGCIMFAEGHQGAFGLGIYSHTVGYDDENAGDEILQFLAKTDEILKDISDEAIYYVDYIYDGVNVKPEHILDIANLNHLWGKDIDESFIAVEHLKITKDMITLMSPDKNPTLKITLPNKVSIVKFNSSQEEYEKLYSETGCVEINLVGTCNKNEWNGYVTPQIFLEDYEIIDRVKYVF